MKPVVFKTSDGIADTDSLLRSTGAGRPAVPVELIFAVLMSVGCFTSGARVVQLVFTPLCAVIAYYLARKSQQRYVVFVLFLWLFTPFVRRVADYHSSFIDPSPILLAPLAASLVVVVRLGQRVGSLFSREFLPFSLVLLGIVYGLIVGILQLPIQAVITDCLRWVVPVLFAAYCLTLKEERLEVIAAVERASIYGLILMGAYGIWQSVSPLPWDLFWLAHVNAESFGSAQNDAVRVFSTMNSPGPFAACASGLMLLLIGSEKKLARLAQILGAAALILTEVRSAWIGIVVGLIYIFLRSGARIKLRLIGLTGTGVLALAMFFAYSTSTEQLANRLNTFSNLKQDESYDERLSGSQRALEHALRRPFGGGLGYLDSAFYTSEDAGGSDLGAHDNGLFEFLVTLGMPGCIFYWAGLLLLLARGLSTGVPVDSKRTACFAVCLSFLAQLPTGNSLFGVDGFVFWIAASMMLMNVEAVRQLEPVKLIEPIRAERPLTHLIRDSSF